MKAITADDFGIGTQVNQAIVNAIEAGQLTHVSLMVNSKATKKAILLAKKYSHRCGFGLHVNLTEGYPLAKTSEVSSLVDKSKAFISNVTFINRLLAKQIQPAQVALEIETQIKYYLKTKLPLTHINTHQNIHLLAPVSGIVVNLAKKYRIAKIRQAKSVFNRLSCFPIKYAVLKASMIIANAHYSALRADITNDFNEILVHPGTPYDDWWRLKNHIS